MAANFSSPRTVGAVETPNQRPIPEIDAEIRALESQLLQLRRERLSRTPPPPFPTLAATPPPGVHLQPSRHKGITGAQVVLALGAIALIAAVASFAGFVWPHLTLELRALALGSLVLALGAAAVFSASRLRSVAEALAASSAASLAVLTLWWYLATSTDPSALGVGTALGVSASITVIAALRYKLQSWVWIGALATTASLAALITDSSPLELTALSSAVFLAAAAWKLRWWQFVWGSGLFALVTLAAATDRISQTSLPPTLAFAAFIAAFALFRDTTSRVPAELQPSVKHVGFALFGFSCFVALSSCLAVIGEPTVTTRANAAISALSLALLAHRTQKLLHARSALLVLALVCATAGLAPVWLAVTLGIALLARRDVPSVVLFSVLVALTAGVESHPGILTGDSPRWFVFLIAAALPAVSCVVARRAELAVLAGLWLSAIVLVLVRTGEPELRAIPIGAVLALCWLLARSQQPGLSTWWFIPAPAVALAPSTILALDGNGAWVIERTSAVLVAAVLLLLLGASRRLAGAFVPGVCALALITVARLTDVVSEIPLWIPLVLTGAALLAAGARFEALENQGRRTVRWLHDLR